MSTLNITLNTKSSLIKYIQIRLKELFNPDLVVSGEYDDNTKTTISDYLQDRFPTLEMLPDLEWGSVEDLTNPYQYFIYQSDSNHTLYPNKQAYVVNDYIASFLLGTVIYEESEIGDIYYTQKLVDMDTSIGVDDYVVGKWSITLQTIIAQVQTQMRKSDTNIVVTGYLDVTTEAYIKSIREDVINDYHQV